MAEEKPQIVEATVARGRTVQIGEEAKGQGEVIQMEKREVKRLRKLGFLVDPDAKNEPVRGTGPNFGTVGGVNVHKVA
ncbi:MAG TPA: hypothetical protein VGH23_16215 [Rhizomicrobium sp.]|jgi:hypothetical protein